MESEGRFIQIMLAVYAQVCDYADPTDHPVTMVSVSSRLGCAVEQVMEQVPALLDDGFLQSSPIGDPPLLYLTKPGLAFARRRMWAA